MGIRNLINRWGNLILVAIFLGGGWMVLIFDWANGILQNFANGPYIWASFIAILLCLVTLTGMTEAAAEVVFAEEDLVVVCCHYLRNTLSLVRLVTPFALVSYGTKKRMPLHWWHHQSNQQNGWNRGGRVPRMLARSCGVRRSSCFP